MYLSIVTHHLGPRSDMETVLLREVALDVTQSTDRSVWPLCTTMRIDDLRGVLPVCTYQQYLVGWVDVRVRDFELSIGGKFHMSNVLPSTLCGATLACQRELLELMSRTLCRHQISAANDQVQSHLATVAKP